MSYKLFRFSMMTKPEFHLAFRKLDVSFYRYNCSTTIIVLTKTTIVLIKTVTVPSLTHKNPSYLNQIKYLLLSGKLW